MQAHKEGKKVTPLLLTVGLQDVLYMSITQPTLFPPLHQSVLSAFWCEGTEGGVGE